MTALNSIVHVCFPKADIPVARMFRDLANYQAIRPILYYTYGTNNDDKAKPAERRGRKSTNA